MASPRTTDLERRIDALMETIERERVDRKAEAEASAARIAELEARLSARSTVANSSSATRRPASAGSPVAKTPGSPTSASKRTAAAADASPQSQDGRASSSARSGGPKSSATATSKFSQRNGAASSDSAASSSAAKKSAPADETTAAQHSWDKLCALVKDDFTVKELWLVSLETLRQLLVHYGVSDPVECAQIECQWALLQEGKEKVERATLKKAPGARASPFTPAKQTGDFDLRNGPGAPTLSRRSPLSGDSIRQCNPNAATERARSVSPGSKGAVVVPPIQGSNPNDSVSPLRTHLGKRTWDAPPTSIYRDNRRPQGKDRSHSPGPQPAQPFPQRQPDCKEGGVKRFASDRETPEKQPRGLKTGYSPSNATARKESLRTGVSSGGGSVNWRMSHGH